mgnify:CR=1 FL=1
MEKLKFYDFKFRKSFHSDEYKYVVKNTSKGKVKFAVAEAPSRTKSWRIVGRSS